MKFHIFNESTSGGGGLWRQSRRTGAPPGGPAPHPPRHKHYFTHKQPLFYKIHTNLTSNKSFYTPQHISSPTSSNCLNIVTDRCPFVSHIVPLPPNIILTTKLLPLLTYSPLIAPLLSTECSTVYSTHSYPSPGVFLHYLSGIQPYNTLIPDVKLFQLLYISQASLLLIGHYHKITCHKI